MLEVEISQNRGKLGKKERGGGGINKQRGKGEKSFPPFLVGTAIFYS